MDEIKILKPDSPCSKCHSSNFKRSVEMGKYSEFHAVTNTCCKCNYSITFTIPKLCSSEKIKPFSCTYCRLNKFCSTLILNNSQESYNIIAEYCLSNKNTELINLHSKIALEIFNKII
jgi:hypothetical protein